MDTFLYSIPLQCVSPIISTVTTIMLVLERPIKRVLVKIIIQFPSRDQLRFVLSADRAVYTSPRLINHSHHSQAYGLCTCTHIQKHNLVANRVGLIPPIDKVDCQSGGVTDAITSQIRPVS